MYSYKIVLRRKKYILIKIYNIIGIILFIYLAALGIPDHLTCLLRNLYAGQEATELHMEQQTGIKKGKEHIKAVYCHPAHSTSMQSTS